MRSPHAQARRKDVNMKNYITLVGKLNVPAGSKVQYDETRDNVGKTGQLLCTVPNGGSLFYTEDELKEAS